MRVRVRVCVCEWVWVWVCVCVCSNPSLALVWHVNYNVVKISKCREPDENTGCGWLHLPIYERSTSHSVYVWKCKNYSCWDYVPEFQTHSHFNPQKCRNLKEVWHTDVWRNGKLSINASYSPYLPMTSNQTIKDRLHQRTDEHTDGQTIPFRRYFSH